jgi:hypothetical protein
VKDIDSPCDPFLKTLPTSTSQNASSRLVLPSSSHRNLPEAGRRRSHRPHHLFRFPNDADHRGSRKESSSKRTICANTFPARVIRDMDKRMFQFLLTISMHMPTVNEASLRISYRHRDERLERCADSVSHSSILIARRIFARSTNTWLIIHCKNFND